MKIGEKEIIINEAYTRWIDKKFNEVLFKDVKSSLVDWKQNLEIPPMNIQNANDYLVQAMTNLTEEEVINLPIDLYDELLDKITELKNGKKSKEKK